MVSCLLLALALATFASPPGLPTFEEYPIPKVYTGTPVKVDLSSHPMARRFRTVLRQGAAKGPNFAGHYTVVTWHCGTECQTVAIVEAKTGKVYFPLLFSASHGVCYQLDSRLLITDPIDRESYRRVIPDWLTTRYFLWNGQKLIRIGESKLLVESNCDPEWKVKSGEM